MANTTKRTSEASQNSHPLSRKGGRGESSPTRGPTAYDGDPKVAIVGGGPTGMALALALHHYGIPAQIFDARPRASTLDDQRILALSHGSRQILEWLGVWQAISVTDIETIHVSQQGSLGRTRLTAQEQDVPALGYVASASDVAAALGAALTKVQIPFHESTRIESAEAAPDEICLHGSNGETRARLVAYAEGAIEADSAAVVRDYGQDAVICTVKHKGPAQRIAYERFTSQGPLALLPCGEELAVVYTCPAENSAALAALSDQAFLENLQAHFGSRLEFTAVSPRHVFPLALRYRKSPIGARSVWLGNAAQTLHPVAGQGFNLALRDIWELARSLAGAADPGDPAVLQRYARTRRLDRRGAIGFTDTLVRVFRNDNPLLRHVRSLGLLALDLSPPARSFVARRMLFGARAW